MIAVLVLLLFFAAAILCGIAPVASALGVVLAFGFIFVVLPRLIRSPRAFAASRAVAPRGWSTQPRHASVSSAPDQPGGITRTGLPARKPRIASTVCG
jgi:hypothetical protein